MDHGSERVEEREPDTGVVQYCYHKQVQYFKPLIEDIAHYHRAIIGADKTGRSFEFLFTAVRRHIRMMRKDMFQEVLSRELTGSTEDAVPATYESAAAPAPG